jgi:branched-chain amino acid transport system ATP-binding protein
MSPVTEPILAVERLTMRFGGLVAIDAVSFTAQRAAITALIGPNGAGKTTVFNCITGFYKPSAGLIRLVHPDGRTFLLERLLDFRIAQIARVARTFQNIRLFPGMTVLENLVVAQHNALMTASGFSFAGLLGLKSYTIGGRPRALLARPHRVAGARRRCRRRPRLRRAEAARDRARHVHRAGAALPRRAGGGAERARER